MKIKDRFKERPIMCSVVISLVVGLILIVGENTICMIKGQRYNDLDTDIFIWPFFSIFFVYHFILTFIHIVSLFHIPKDIEWTKIVKRFEYITIVLGFLYTRLYIWLFDIKWNIEWYKQVKGIQLHQPIWTGGKFAFFFFGAIGIMGYVLLSSIKLEKMPPLIIVLSIAAMYIGIIECVIWCIQIFSKKYCLLCLFPLNYIIIAIKTVRYKISEWNTMELHHHYVYEGHPVLNYFSRKLTNATYWPTIAFVLLWPFMGIMICILALFGQTPDIIIKTWTETAEWRLSQQIAPPNLPDGLMMGHYLCTVAAMGHSRIVKPLRMGERHGYPIVVNRQLCIANAFEQIIEERMPLFHKWIRNLYDTYGFPVAKLIRTKGAADVVYFIMKPLEWFFLIVIYLCDTQPEKRIALQYLPKQCIKDS
ncbi:MAG: hypothetical protein K2N51_03490 [Lachnospiraceae bacterium]|nr:hypothetical protein [Lachnospiraceae bacterium]